MIQMSLNQVYIIILIFDPICLVCKISNRFVMRNIFSPFHLQSSPRHRHVIKSGTQLIRRLRRLPPRFHLGRGGLLGRGRQRRRRGDPAVAAGEGTDRRGEDPRRSRSQLMHGLPAQVDGGRQVH